MNIRPRPVTAKNWIVLLSAAALPLVGSISTARADLPDQRAHSAGVPALSGIYKVTASSDPLFPTGGGNEWFIDFSEGMSGGKTHGKAAVSLRRNPRVQVRILVWQMYPNEGTLVIGNQFHEGARGAVALASWKISGNSNAISLARNGHQLVLRKADPADY